MIVREAGCIHEIIGMDGLNSNAATEPEQVMSMQLTAGQSDEL